MAGQALILPITGYPVIDDALEDLLDRIKKLEKRAHDDHAHDEKPSKEKSKES